MVLFLLGMSNRNRNKTVFIPVVLRIVTGIKLFLFLLGMSNRNRNKTVFIPVRIRIVS